MKLAIVIQKGICQEEFYAGMKAHHECYIVEVPDGLFPKEVKEAYEKMYGDEQHKFTTITDVWLCNPKV